MKKNTLYVVTAIDTEGLIDDPAKPDILNSWAKVDGLADRLFSEDFRFKVKDKEGNGIIMSWFILTLSGFLTNPFNRPMGYHKIYDHYINRYGKDMAQHGDGVYWHYHQPAKSGKANEWSADWIFTNEYDNILARLLIERKFFPSCFRAGGRIENDDTSGWLEEIIPFDYSCCSGNINWDNIESDGRALREVCDWSSAPADWSWYHPDKDNYQLAGDQKRYMFRCPDLASPVHTMTDKEIIMAFERTSAGQDTIISFFEHDRRNNAVDKLLDIYNRIEVIGDSYPNVIWRYANAQEAAVSVTGLPKLEQLSFDIDKRENNQILVSANQSILSRMPFVAVASADNSACYRSGLVVIGKNKWLTNPLPDDISQVGVAAVGISGEQGLNIYSV